MDHSHGVFLNWHSLFLVLSSTCILIGFLSTVFIWLLSGQFRFEKILVDLDRDIIIHGRKLLPHVLINLAALLLSFPLYRVNMLKHILLDFLICLFPILDYIRKLCDLLLHFIWLAFHRFYILIQAHIQLLRDFYPFIFILFRQFSQLNCDLFFGLFDASV